MPAEKPFSVGLLGLGTVGTGVARLLREHAPRLEERLGFPLRLARIADIDLERDRGIPLDGVVLGRDWRELVADPGIELVIELIGGTGVAREAVLGALAAGKPVVTANKALLAHHGDEIFARAAASAVDVAFEAAVAGAIPLLRALREGLCADRIRSVHGIVNGTCNFVLSEMDERGEPYAAVLERAQRLGLAEADPSFDVSGRDSAHKLAILAALALSVRLAPNQIHTEGIERVTPLDIEYARRFGFRIKLLAIAKESDGGVEARVHPTMIPEASVLARVNGPLNAVEVRGQFSGPTLYCGPGAGSLPTASAVVGDVMELARARRLGAVLRVPPLGVHSLRTAAVRNLEDLEGEHYLRFTVPDRPGVLGRIASALGEHGISLASVLQPERHEAEAVPVVVTTHPAKEQAVGRALAELDRERVTAAPTQLIRIEREI